MAHGRSAVLAFRLADRRFALDAGRVAEVVRRPPLTRVPLAPPSLAGVVALRGRVIPVISLAKLLGVEAGGGAAERLIVLAGREPLGLAVDEVIGLEAEAGRGLVGTADGAARMLSLDDLLAQASAEGSARTGLRHAPDAPEAFVPVGRIATQSLLTFSLAGQPYALPLAQVREVVPIPAEVASLPRADAAMVGAAALRGALIPIVSTRVLLGLPSAPPGASDRVVVATIGDARVGFMVDRVSAIVHAPQSAISPVPKVLNRGAGEARVAAILRIERGLTSVLDAEQLFAEESVAHILEDARGADDPERSDREPEAYRRLVIFRVGDETYGLDILAVEEVASLPERLTPLPRAPDYVLGVMSLRGVAVPVIDQRRRFRSGGEAPARPRVLVARIGELVAGFAVDAVTEILELPASRLSPTPELAQDAARLFDQVAQVGEGDRPILIVNPRELLDRAERDLVAALAAASAAQ